MKEHPILFDGDAVRALLMDRKTQTRKPVKPQPVPSSMGEGLWIVKTDGRPSGMACINATDWDVRYWCERWRPYEVGDHLWVRETWAPADDGGAVWFRAGIPEYRIGRTTGNWLSWPYQAPMGIEPPDNVKWRPSIHMPRWASRITLGVTGVRVQRVQEIWTAHKDSLDPWCDIFAEGIPQEAVWDGAGAMPTPLSLFIQLWNAIYAKRGLGWETNPWVWAIEFRRELSAGGEEG